jgi:hypothetical protein
VISASRWSLSLLLLIVGATLAAGCYTVLRHPESDALIAEEDGAPLKACGDCHADSPYYHDAFDPHSYAFGSYWRYPGWSDYYFRPWWYRDYWYYDGGPADPGVPVETGGRHVWGSGGRRDMDAIMTPVFPAGGGQSFGSPSAGASSGSGSVGGSTGSRPDEKPKSTRNAESHRATSRREMGAPSGSRPAPTDTAGAGAPGSPHR